MAEIVDIAGYRKQKLAKAVAVWEEYMSRAEQFQKDGKEKFADQMLDKAKAAREEIDKLRPPVPKKSNKAPRFLAPDSNTPVTFTFNSWLPEPPESA